MADWAAARHRIRRDDADEGRLLEKSHFQMELVRSVLGRHVAVARPDNVADIQAVRLLPRVPVADLRPAQLLPGSDAVVDRLQIDNFQLDGSLRSIRIKLERRPA